MDFLLYRISVNVYYCEMDGQQKLKLTVDDHRNKGLPAIANLFDDLRRELLQFDSICEVPTRPYVGYKYKNSGTGKKLRLFAEIHILREKISVHLRPIEYKASNINVYLFPDTHLWTLRKGIDISTKNELKEALELIRQSYNDVI